MCWFHRMRFFVVVFLMLGVHAPLAVAEPLLLNTGTRAPYTTDDKQGFLNLLITEAFRRIGREAEVVVYEASKRALINANKGIDAGAAMRVKALNETYTDLIRVPEKIIDNDFVAYTLGDPFPVNGFDGLTPYAVGHILGWKVFEGKLDAARQVIKARSPDQLLTLIAKHRVDLILYERWQGLWRAKTMGLPLKVLEPPLVSVEMYLFLHKSHSELVEPVAAALREMKRDGTYDAIIQRTLIKLTS